MKGPRVSFPRRRGIGKGGSCALFGFGTAAGQTVDNPFVLKGTIEKSRISGNGRRFFSSPKGMTGNVPLRRAV